jgi:3-deoxy-D-manno-octulosonate 8-phosphate phosphatase (KDO 8-P phosphatase)
MIFDIDGVFTDGKFLYSEKGKVFKSFGSWDSEALELVSNKVDFIFISADPRGFKISQKRINDLGYKLNYVASIDRVGFIMNLQKEHKTIYIADSFTDYDALLQADLSFVPKGAHASAKKASTFVLKAKGSEGAVAEMIHKLIKLNIIKKNY